MPEFEALAKRLKEFRKAKHETQFEFAENCGLSDDLIYQLEHQKTNPKLSSLQDIAAYLGITVSDLLQVDDQNPTKYTYRVKTTSISGGQGNSRSVYGIEVLNSIGRSLKVVPNIFLDATQAEKFVDLCNSEELDIIHLDDVIEDLLI